MQGVFVILLLLIWRLDISNSLNISKSDVKAAQLIFANVIFRHGDRNVILEYPTSLYKNESEWDHGFGQLTELGITQEIELGQYLAKRYESILPADRFPNNVVFIQSTDCDRTLMSASACASGLFPPKGDQMWRGNLPIHSIPKHLDYVLFAGKYCPRYNRAIRAYFESTEYTALIAKFSQLFKYLEEKSGMQITSFDDVQTLYNTLWIEDLKNKTLPEWTNETPFEGKKVFGEGSDFEWCANYDFKIRAANPELARLSIGFLLREMLEHFTQKVNSTLQPNRSLWLYSAHDTTIANVLNALGLFELHTPPYSSSLHFELYKTKDVFFVQLFYRNSSEENLLALDIPECGKTCSLEEFYRIYRDIIPNGAFEEECQLPMYLRILEGDHICIAAEYLVVLVLIALALPITVIVFCKLLYRKRGSIVMSNNTMKYF